MEYHILLLLNGAERQYKGTETIFPHHDSATKYIPGRDRSKQRTVFFREIHQWNIFLLLKNLCKDLYSMSGVAGASSKLAGLQ